MLSSTARSVRLAVSAVVIGLLLVGTFVGHDDAFPFGPFRMYATSNAATGEIAVLTLEARVDGGDWERVTPSPSSVGMNVAEFEGQLPRFEEDSALLGAVARSAASLHPDDPEWVGVRIVRRATVVVDKVPTGEVRESVLVEWSAT